ncbi:MAG TPA: HlyD family efflux transporter periplasmic adaptor subunit [Tepidisphaeraceae bacterium]|jgi:multidrug efflux pump subunit AcrA (membrane-fusion protein)|nr:HlyD family efflux transporter periplasmic adaptor subunit [Tepidisphaeraceae bacterium]
MRIKRLLALTVLSGGLLAAAGAPTASKNDNDLSSINTEAADDGKLSGNTVPSEKAEMTLGSRSSDVVWDVKVKKGDIVKPGQVLAVEDTREEEAELKTTELMANSEVAVRAAQVTQKQKELEVKRMAGKENVFTQYELDKAQYELDLATLDIEKAQVEQTRYKYQAEQLRTQIERKKLVSRIGGIVRDINIEKGGVVDPQKPAIVVINNDPLWVDVHVPIDMSLALLRMQKAQPDKKLEFGVLYKGAKAPIPAKVIFIDPQADYAGKTQKMTLEIKNDEQLPAGIEVQVIPPALDKVAEAKVK